MIEIVFVHLVSKDARDNFVLAAGSLCGGVLYYGGDMWWGITIAAGYCISSHYCSTPSLEKLSVAAKRSASLTATATRN